jgi:hypothetical protein
MRIRSEDVLGINRMVENKMSGDEENQAQFKKWYIRKYRVLKTFYHTVKIKRLNFDELSGIVVVESDPPNFGEWPPTVDLRTFLFFNETTKTTKAEEIFNRFSNSNT